MEAAEAVTGRMVARELYFKRISTQITNQLSNLELALSDDLSAALARLSLKDEARLQAGNYTTDRLRKLIALVQTFSVDWARAVRDQIETGALDIIEAEIEFERQFLATYAADAGIALSLDATITPRQIFTAAKRRPMDTRVMKEVFPEMSRNVKRRVVQSLRTSYQAGDSIGQAMARLRSDQELGINRRGAEGLARSGMSHYANNAALDSLQAMGISAYMWISTLDSRVTEICRSRDQRIYQIKDGVNILPPAHFRCRSAIVGHWGEELEGTRASKGPEGGKQVDAGLNFEQWLRRQDKSYAREILGPTSYRIWATGVPVTKFTDAKATRAFTATELRQKYASLFDS